MGKDFSLQEVDYKPGQGENKAEHNIAAHTRKFGF
jgi:hypothetical protein